jgi:phosphatidylglycerol:prolipoprotein diacylglycerol transferase
MYPDLSYFFHDLIGTEYDNWLAIFKTFGLLLATSLVLAGWVVYRELKRLEAIEDGPYKNSFTKITQIIGATPTWKDVVPGIVTGFIIGFKFFHIQRNFELFKADPVKVLFSLDGDLLYGVLAALLLGGIYYWDKNRKKLAEPLKQSYMMRPSDRVGDIIILAGVSGVLGAKIFAMFETIGDMNSMDEFWDQLLSGSGLAIYGGLIGGGIVVAAYVRKVKMPVLTTMDVAAPAMILAMGTGRLGCHLSGDGDWGIQAAAQPEWWFLPDWLWSMDYPRDVNMGRTGAQAGMTPPDPISIDCDGCKYHYKLGYKVYPTSVYEFFMYSGTFVLLMVLRKKILIPGFLFCLYMSLYGIERWFIEKIRVNDEFWMGLTQAEFISVGFFIIGVLGMGILYARSRD